MIKRAIVIVAHNIRSLHNVGSIFRSADGFGVEHIYCTGYTPYPAVQNDSRLPHIRDKQSAVIAKVALGAEKTIASSHEPNAQVCIERLRGEGYKVVALEQTPYSQILTSYEPPDKIALILGEEVHGIPQDILSLTEVSIEIPMFGDKESLNVSVATGIALYHLRCR